MKGPWLSRMSPINLPEERAAAVRGDDLIHDRAGAIAIVGDLQGDSPPSIGCVFHGFEDVTGFVYVADHRQHEALGAHVHGASNVSPPGDRCGRSLQRLRPEILAGRRHAPREAHSRGHRGGRTCGVSGGEARRRSGMGPLYTPFEETLRIRDVITMHSPLTASTRTLIAEAEFAQMAKRPILIKTARGGLGDEESLIRALDSGQITGAGFDVA